MTLEAAPAWRPVPPSVGWILLALAHLSLAGIAIGLWSPVAFPLALTLAAVALYFAMAPDDVVLGIGMALLYANAGAVAVTVHGVPAIAAVGVLGLVAWPLVRAFFDGRPLGPATMPASVPWVVGYLLVMVASSFGAQDREAAADAVLTFLMEGLPLYLLMIAVVQTPGRLRRVLWVLLAAGAGVATLSVVQALTGDYGQDFLGFARTSEAELARLSTDLFGRFDPPRAGGPIGEKNFFAQMLTVLVPVGLVLATTTRSVPRRLLALGATAVVLGGIAATGSRGAAVALVLVVVVMVATGDLRPRHALVGAVVVVALLAAFPSYGERLTALATASTDGAETTLDDPAVLGRASSMLGSLRVFSDNPVLGVGPDNYGLHHRDAAIEVGLKVVEGREPHSLLLGLAAETGLLGLVAFCGVLAVTAVGLVRARRQARRRAPDEAPLYGALLYVLVAWFASGIFLHLAYERYFWTWIGLSSAAAAIGTRGGGRARS